MLEVINVSSNIIRKESLMKILFSLVMMTVCSLSANGQNFDLKEYAVIQNGEVLPNAFVGGYTAAQLNEIDFNMDGKMDLLVFDRRGDVARSYVHDGVVGSTNYSYEPKYLFGLPPLKQFVRVRDYNQDGIPDIYTGPSDITGGIALYIGEWDGERLRFDLFKNEDYPFDVITVTANGSLTQVYVGPGDVPAIVDVDFDGDLDIFSFESGGSYVTYFQNMSVERNLGADVFDYVIGDFCWGNFKEGGLDGTLFLSDSPGQCAEEFAANQTISERHAGSAIEMFDYQCDGDYDMLIGDLLGNNMVLAINEPNEDNAFVSQAINNFPENDPVDMHVFLSSWVLDIDHDGDQDFVVCPNDESNVTNVSNFHYYENTGYGCNEQFELKQEDLLNDGSVDLGTDASPVFCDYNADGLIDLIVGTSGEFTETGQIDKIRLVLFENTGDSENPKYQMVDDDYLSFSINSMTSGNPTPTIGDLDGDGDEDMIVGDSNGDLYYFENIAGEGNTYQFAQAVYPYKNIDVGATVEPYIFDYNGDGLGDLFIGEKGTNSNEGLGNINYYENVGAIGEVEFVEDLLEGNNTPTFGYINTKLITETSGNSAPVPFFVGNDFYILCGTKAGFLQLYKCDPTNPNETCEPIDLEFGKLYEGDETSIDLADIDSDGFLEVVIGNKRGGIAIYNTIINIDGTISDTEDFQPSSFDINLYPNPTSKQIFVESDLELSNYQLNNIFGQKLYEGKVKNNSIDLGQLPAGVYFILFEYESEMLVKRIIKN